MTENFKKLLCIFGAAVFGREYEPGQDIEIGKIYELAVQQGIWQTVYLALHKKYDLKKYEAGFLQSVSKNIERTYFTNSMVELLRKEGVDSCYIKGISVARFYKNPECRISGDTDILISAKDVQKAREFLKLHGFEVEGDNGNMYHFEARHPKAGILEVHTGLYQRHYEELVFKGLTKYNEPWIKVKTSDFDIKTMGINDGLNHLTAHYAKHFISRGAGLRQLMDLLLYMQYYKNDIDWEKYKRLWNEIGLYNLIKTAKGVGVRYWDMELDDYSETCTEEFLSDVEEGGVFGYDNEHNKDFLNVFLTEREKNNIASYKKYMKKNVVRGTFAVRLFPNSFIMVKRGYRYAARGGVFLAFSWLHRFTDMIWAIIRGRKKIKNMVDFEENYADDNTKERLELMKDMGIL